MNKELLEKIEKLIYKNQGYFLAIEECSRINKEIEQLLQEEEQEYKWICKECVTRCYAPFGNKPDTCIYSYIAFQKWQPIKKEQEEPELVKGMVCNASSGVVIYNGKTHPYRSLLKPIDWKTLAITIAHFIPNAKKAILHESGYIYFKNYMYGNCEYKIPYPNPSGKRQEIDIERG